MLSVVHCYGPSFANALVKKSLVEAYSLLRRASPKDGYYSATSEGVVMNAHCQENLNHEQCMKCVKDVWLLTLDLCRSTMSNFWYGKRCYISSKYNNNETLDKPKGKFYPVIN
ncbi:hypothetical protein L2E82_49463 [Cichorium intybus]|uniref:Uncharacterized protein n=1 Tax=Cichorium intybus TaxID=13427 RepID=A0ACB8Z0Z1_CICIN|nr:hypothetical protein L2E82_49463 [Cichorium intybus]